MGKIIVNMAFKNAHPDFCENQNDWFIDMGRSALPRYVTRVQV